MSLEKQHSESELSLKDYTNCMSCRILFNSTFKSYHTTKCILIFSPLPFRILCGGVWCTNKANYNKLNLRDANILVFESLHSTEFQHHLQQPTIEKKTEGILNEKISLSEIVWRIGTDNHEYVMYPLPVLYNLRQQYRLYYFCLSAQISSFSHQITSLTFATRTIP